MGASGKVVVGLVVEGVGNSKVDADNNSSGLRGGMSSCRNMAVGRCGSNRSISRSRCGSNRSSSSSRSSSNMFIDSSNRISSNTFSNSSSNYSLIIPLITHRPNGGSGGHLILVLTLLGGTKRSRHPRPILQWAACTSANGAEDSGI